MAFKRSAVRSRLSPPTRKSAESIENLGFQCFFCIYPQSLLIQKSASTREKRTKKRTILQNGVGNIDTPAERVYLNGKYQRKQEEWKSCIVPFYGLYRAGRK